MAKGFSSDRNERDTEWQRCHCHVREASPFPPCFSEFHISNRGINPLLGLEFQELGMPKWTVQRSGPEWLMDSRGRVFGYRDRRGGEFLIPQVAGSWNDAEKPGFSGNPSIVDAEGNPVVAGIRTQPVRTGNFTLVASDSNTIIPVTGDVIVTINAASDLTAPVEIKRHNAGALSAVATGVTLIDPFTGLAWGALSVANKLSSLIFVLGSAADEYGAVKFGA